jgi:hypothetical protein
MPESIAWSLTISGTAGSAIQSAGQTTGDGIVSVSVDLEAGSDERALDLQVDDIDRVSFLAVSSSLTDGKVTVKADGPAEIALTGPMLLIGPAAKLFAGDLSTLTVHNTSAADPATVKVLIGLTL